MAKLTERQDNNSLRMLPMSKGLIDFSSNDYLGLARNEAIFIKASKLLQKKGVIANGATGSRLLTGNNGLYRQLEEVLASFFGSKSALVFNSGYDANIGF